MSNPSEGGRSARAADDGRSPRMAFVLVALVLIGCAIVPVGPLRLEPARLPRFDGHHPPYAAGDVIFSHEVHDFTDCQTCHFESIEAVDRRAVDLPAMGVCFECHEGETAPRDCITCHLENRRDRKPVFHDAPFARHHRRMAETEAYKCALCHAESDCRGCHLVQKPLSHTPRFNRSTHGRMATRDRESCATCHTTSFCEGCHSQPPPDHTPAFIGDPVTGRAGHKQAALIRGRSCLVCHSFEDACARCHRR